MDGGTGTRPPFCPRDTSLVPVSPIHDAYHSASRIQRLARCGRVDAGGETDDDGDALADEGSRDAARRKFPAFARVPGSHDRDAP